MEQQFGAAAGQNSRYEPSTWTCDGRTNCLRGRAKLFKLPSVIQQMKTVEQGVLLPIQLSKENLWLLLTIPESA